MKTLHAFLGIAAIVIGYQALGGNTVLYTGIPHELHEIYGNTDSLSQVNEYYYTELEPNNDTSTANGLIYSPDSGEGLGVYVQGNIQPESPDVFSFTTGGGNTSLWFQAEDWGLEFVIMTASGEVLFETKAYTNNLTQFHFIGMQGGTYYLKVTQSRDTSISVKYTFRYSYPEVAESNTEESNESSEEQSSTSNSSNTTSGSTSQSSLSSSTEVAVKKVASIKAYGLHAFLDVGSSSGGGSLYFTTYDGRSTWPLNDSNRISGELKQSSFGSSNFVTDYLAGNYYGVYEHGTVTLSMPTLDSDSNGVPDWLQKNMSVNSNISGSSKLHYLSSGAVSGDSTIRGTITRSAGLSSGNYSLTYTISGYGSSTASGVWYVGYYDGTIEYDGSSYSISARTLNPDGNTVTATGSSEFSISDENTLNIGVINLDVDGDTIQLQAGSLNRSGSKYAGFAKAIDGNANTSWADYIDWYIEISDPNDSDNDNIPDFTDPVEARSLSTSLDLSGWSWHSWPWVYNNSLKSWLYYASSAVWSYKHQKWFFWDDSSESWVDSN